MKHYNVNVVHSCQAKEMTPVVMTWEDLQTFLSKVDPRGLMNLREYLDAPDNRKKEDKDGMGWIPCSAIDPFGSRAQDNMDKACCIVLDIDTGMSLGDVKGRIVGYEAIIHSSFSHSPEHPKWRVVFPLVEAMPAKDIGRVFDHFQDRFDGLLDSSCGHDPARLYYTPACPADAEPHFHYEHIEGEFLDGRAILIHGAESSPVVLTRAVVPIVAVASHAEGVVEGGRNSAAFKLAAKLFNDGLEIEQVTEDLLAWNDKNVPPLDAAEVRLTVKSAMKTVAKKVAATSIQIVEIVDAMNRKYGWVNKQRSVYRFEHDDFVSIESLRNNYANTGVKVRIGDSEKWQTYADVWFRSDKRNTYTGIDFVPGAASIVDNKINLWKGFGVEPVEGDIAPWVEFLDYLFSGNADARKWIEQWIAYPIQYPGAKLTTSAVLWSIKQGVGKSMLGETVGKLYGNHFKTISAAELHGTFNGWMRCCQFVLGEENSSSDQRADSNKLKGMITGNTIFVNEKYQPAFELPNCVNFLFTSNDPCAFHLEDADRRFFVWEIIANRISDEFYAKFIDWRNDSSGLSALMHHLVNLDLTGFNPKGNALVTESKREMIQQSKSEMERWQGEALADEDSVMAVFGKQVSSEDEIAEIFNSKHRTRVSSTAARRALRKHHHYASRRVITCHGRKMLVSLVNHDNWESASNEEWGAEYDKSHSIIARMSL